MLWLYFHCDRYFKVIFVVTIDDRLNVIFQYKLSYFRHAGMHRDEAETCRKSALNPAANAGRPAFQLLSNIDSDKVLMLPRRGYPDVADPP
ncbi:hypothetical protein CO653_31770 [Rhizobium anhuiense]|uniref:Uncharacterized protein n=1 Tax=Rhizobium anhuiense TaxID=1184720 RepID=A0A3S0Q0D2_9HYPH|nr:hypothetical protein AS890_01570 [Rhizobium anhuiense bv. trifolii]PDS34116.1 hypothetical protein CO665_32645 [Rhizobium anhuiense]PDS54718.1 hypothetical protein CO663_34110 [Rhizobium anhuiense]PDS61734.1 hypothetical protein CO653_31770 [Rhizobium anhuiense]RUL95734.1 hypothetical protein EEQ99_33585 [Rhizobium anhuiense]